MQGFNFPVFGKRRAAAFFVLLLSIPGLVVAQSSTRYYVNHAAPAGGDGSSWSNAFRSIQRAIDAASEEIADEIWVASGTYYPEKTPPGHTLFRHRANRYYRQGKSGRIGRRWSLYLQFETSTRPGYGFRKQR